MCVKLVSAALLVAVLGVSAAHSQTVSQIGGPKELPPAGYSAMQYIDSRGCVFLRAGVGGNVSWVPRVGQNRKVLCGYPPTLGGKSVAVAAAPEVEAPAPVVVQPAPKPVVVAQSPAAPRVKVAVPMADYVPPPARTGKVIPTQQPVVAALQPAVTQPLVMAVDAGSSVTEAEGRIGCPASAPRLQRVPLTNGGTVLVCTPGDGVLRNLRAPVFAEGAGVGAAFDDAPPAVARVAAAAPLGQGSGRGRPAANVRVAAPSVEAPAGYTLAWDDDRLNPLRGVGTASGQAMQDQVWTRKVPAKLVGDTRKARREAARERLGTQALSVSTQSASAARQQALTVSTKSEPVAARQGGYYVQAGSFGVPANAEGALARLAAAGLPVARGRANGLTVVMAGPFGSPAEAAAARGIARSAGFGDAFVR